MCKQIIRSDPVARSVAASAVTRSLFSSPCPLLPHSLCPPCLSSLSLHLCACHPPSLTLCFCPELTLLGLNSCRCLFGLGTAGTAAESRGPLVPLSICLSDRHTLIMTMIMIFSLIVTAGSHQISSLVLYFLQGVCLDMMTRPFHGEIKVSSYLHLRTCRHKEVTQTHEPFQTGDERKELFVLHSVQSDVKGRREPGSGEIVSAADWLAPQQWLSSCRLPISSVRAKELNQILLC